MTELLKERSSPSVGRALHGQEVLGQPVCGQAFCKLLGIGHGRFQKLKAGVKRGAVPVDMRFLNRSKHRRVSESRTIVHDYLAEIYEKIAEPMPEASEAGMVRSMAFRKRKGKRPRILKAQRKIMEKDRRKSAMRLLPPGTYTDYLAILRNRHPTMRLSLKLFSDAPRFRGCGMSLSVLFQGFCIQAFLTFGVTHVTHV